MDSVETQIRPRQTRLSRMTGSLETAALLVAFILSYDFLYLHYLSPSYGYLGFSSFSRDPIEFAFACICALSVIAFLPGTIKRFSDYFLWFVYAMVYVPAVITASRMGILEGGSYQLVALVTASMYMMSIVTRTIPAPFAALAGRSQFSNLNFLILISAMSTAYLTLTFYPIMRLSAIDVIYDQRALAGAFGAGRLTGYILNWTAYAFIPILLTAAIIQRRLGLCVFSILGLLIVYSINAAKIVFVIAFILIAINALFSIRLAVRPGRLLLIPLIPTLAILVLVYLIEMDFSPTLNFFVSQILMRAIAIQAVMLSIYAEFFELNLLTYWSHVTGISSIVQYPYTQPLGIEIGIYIVGGDGFNANSGFWATDGLGAFGKAGILIASFIVSLLLVLINMIGARTDLRFLCVALTPFCLAVANTSFFTAFVTGGGLIAVILCTKLPKAYKT